MLRSLCSDTAYPSIGEHSLCPMNSAAHIVKGSSKVKPRRAPAFGPARHSRFAGGAFTPPLTKGMLTPPWNPSIRAGCEHLIGGFPRTTGSNLAHHTFWRTLKTNAPGCQRPLKQWCLVPVCEHGHGGCDDINGDTRLGRGLPFGRISVIRPPPPMSGELREGGTKRWHVQSVVKVVAKQGRRVIPGGRTQHSWSSSISMPPGLMSGPTLIGWRCPRIVMSNR